PQPAPSAPRLRVRHSTRNEILAQAEPRPGSVNTRCPVRGGNFTITESNEVGTRCDTSFCEQAERQLDTSLVIDMKFGWFSDHEESVALSLSENIDRLGLRAWPEQAGRRTSSGLPLRKGSTFAAGA
ncbi:hypothetical protein JS756_35450, partial [Streptomyces actuosus]